MSTRASRKRQPAPTRRYELTLKDELAGYHVTMGSMTSRQMIRLRSGEMTEGDSMELAASTVVEHDFDVADIRDLEYWVLLEISRAWAEAMQEAAVPPPTGDSSPKP